MYVRLFLEIRNLKFAVEDSYLHRNLSSLVFFSDPSVIRRYAFVVHAVELECRFVPAVCLQLCNYECNYMLFLAKNQQRLNLESPNSVYMTLRYPGLGLILGQKCQRSRSRDLKVFEYHYAPSVTTLR